MRRSILIAAAIAALLAAVSVSAFLYLTRGVAAPSENVQDTVQRLSTTTSNGSQVVFRISQDDSKVEYNISEVLNGTPKTVVGTTSQVAGDILVNITQPSASQIGDISINARTFATDDDRRDNSVARFILQSESDANQFITFKPTSMSGLPDQVAVGDSLQFQVTGDLTIAGITQLVTFDVTATLQSDSKLVGHAETTVQRSAFNLTIPNVPFVANVGDTVTLKLDFVANAVTASS